MGRRQRSRHFRLLDCLISLIGSILDLIWLIWLRRCLLWRIVWRNTHWTCRNIWFSSLLSGWGIVLILFLLLLFNVFCLCHFYYLYRLVRPRVILTAWIHWLIYSLCRLSTLWRILYLLSIRNVIGWLNTLYRILYLLSISILLGWLLCWSILSIWSSILICVLIVIFVALNLIVVRITHLELIIIIIYKLNKLRYFNISLIL